MKHTKWKWFYHFQHFIMLVSIAYVAFDNNFPISYFLNIKFYLAIPDQNLHLKCFVFSFCFATHQSNEIENLWKDEKVKWETILLGRERKKCWIYLLKKEEVNKHSFAFLTSCECLLDTTLLFLLKVNLLKRLFI